MLFTQDLFPSATPWLFLVITLITAFVKPKLWPFGLLCTLISGLFYNAIDLVGLGVVTLLLAMSYYAKKISTKPSSNPSNKLWNRRINTVITALVIISCIALAAHLLPGFNNLQVLNDVEKSINSMPFTLYLNFDKPMILFVLLMLSPALLISQKPITLSKAHNSLRLSALVVLVFILLFSLAILLSLIKYDPQLPSWWWLFALNNLLLTCIIEEVFFRGFIQQKLTKLINPLTGLILTSLLFGIAHFSGGFNYMLVATLAGFLYGLVYLNTGKIWYAILLHFCFNMIHLALFTYPLLKV
ncbi:CPBP family intramembrane glutamic endopeptidase [Colwellia psychrerythraea]|uniref:CAAX amino terminal protease family protein n=1 Tax=Colwellia psychrerythraea (strain 34H / ATCC BAA-681) TaxID=167879 RepID=Q482R6_COLP3|nr:CPBP family intramembrane glutamic endopeptidase [Colwellia psychrerythraea]AAZ23972.1 CAAX amino terminal protease family protein [Colwellia psychrerythraea 34H]